MNYGEYIRELLLIHYSFGLRHPYFPLPLKRGGD